MNAQAPVRGAELVAGGGRFGPGPRWLARAFAGSVQGFIDRIDAGLNYGSIEARLPDGTIRRLGGRGEGFRAELTVLDWRALLRVANGGSAGWYQAWEAGEWTSPDPVPLFALFMQIGTRAGSVANCSPAAPSPQLQHPSGGAAQCPRPLRPGQRLLFVVARSDDELFLREVRHRGR
jgi:cyclopropane-fatty-acyl-phospholipid synthase